MEANIAEEEGGADNKFDTTKQGDRFKDLALGSGAEVTPGATVELRYRVMRSGKRSRDGISGEAQSLYSLGYGEDDDAPGATLVAPLGSGRLVAALDDGLIGMRVGGRRRVQVRPERGWKLAPENCVEKTGLANAVNIAGQGLVPLATVDQVEGCIAELQPAPKNFQDRRRLARRFDEALIVETELVSVTGGQPPRAPVVAATDTAAAAPPEVKSAIE